MQVGDLVRWRHPNETDVGLVTEIDFDLMMDPDQQMVVKVLWSDGCDDWYEPLDLEVINGSR